MKIYILKRYEKVWFNRFEEEIIGCFSEEELAKERIDKELLNLEESKRSLVEFEIYEEELIGPETIF
jgi:hypothetical protein